ncbi:hypothetical protein JCM3774_002961 [Rhodotorula dairenensis]
MFSPLRSLLFAVGALAVAAHALPARDSPARGTTHQHEARQSNCHANQIELYRTGTTFLCINKYYLPGGIALLSIGYVYTVNAASQVADWVTSRWQIHSLSVTPTSSGRRDDSIVYVTSNGTSQVAVYAATVDDRRVVQITDWLAAAGDRLIARSGSSDAAGAATLVGGQVAYFLNGTLDTFTLDFALEDTVQTTNGRLATRNYDTLHTTYWATSGHDSTSLSYGDVQSLALKSYTLEPSGASQVCGYMANSGSWHGAFRHWTGDNGYSIGEHFHLTGAALLAFATAVSGAPAGPVGVETLEARGSTCHYDDIKIWSSGSSFVCRGELAYDRGAAINSIGAGTVSNVASQVADWVNSRAHSGSTQAGRRRLRLARRSDPATEADDVLSVRVGDVQVAVPFVESDGRLTISIGAFLQAKHECDNDVVKKRDFVESGALVGGSASYFSDGALDTCTLDFEVPTSAFSSIEAAASKLEKRSTTTLHTTYWATSGHDATDLSWNSVYNVATASYRSQPDNVGQVCGYMANSGSWHGAYRHWTGDYGYVVGECDDERKF